MFGSNFFTLWLPLCAFFAQCLVVGRENIDASAGHSTGRKSDESKVLLRGNEEGTRKCCGQLIVLQGFGWAVRRPCASSRDANGQLQSMLGILGFVG